MKHNMSKKFLSLLCALLALTLVVSIAPLGSFADEAEEPAEEEVEVTVEKKEVNACVFSWDSTKTVECLFRSDLPEVPYVDPVDYLGTVYIGEFTVTKNDDGAYVVTNPNEQTMVIDAEKDTVYFEAFEAFIDCEINQEGNSLDINYVEYTGGNYTVEPKAVLIDLSAYHIDVLEQDGKVYLPLSVLAGMFAITYNNANYIDGKICFVHTSDPESYYYETDESVLYEETTRSKAMAEFTYNNICLFFDKFFGHPANTVIAETLRENGLDQALEQDEYTRLAKQFLRSESMIEYFHGLSILSYYVSDGGHTVLYFPAVIGVNTYGDTPLADAWYAAICEENETADIVWTHLNEVFATFDIMSYLPAVRDAMYAQYEDEIAAVWEENGAYLIIHGDTAVFVFDSFDPDTPSDLKEALDTAKAAGVKNFILDDSCNGGGYVAANMYIITMITNAKYHKAEYHFYDGSPLTGSVAESVYKVDLNLDGEFDEKDDETYYDFNFAILTSSAAFSCGNSLPVYASDLGVMILGETSGGGSCHVTERYLPDGFYFPISDISKNVRADGTDDVDLGAEPDVYLVGEDEEGNPDYTGFYDIEALGDIVEEFYGNEIVDTGIDPLPVVILGASLILLALAICMLRRRRLSAQ